MQRSELWPVPSAHRSYWEQHNCAHVHEYDPTDDGPEVGAIRQIFYRHDDLDIEIERNTYQIYLLLNNLFADFAQFDFGGFDFDDPEGGLFN